MKFFITFLVLLLCFVETPPQPQSTFGSIIVTRQQPARRSIRLVSYDCGFAWMAQDYGDSRDFGGNTTPGVFVHSKSHDRWLQILRVSTAGAKFGKSDPEARIQAPWDFTRLSQEAYVQLPIPTSGSIHLPDRVVYNESRNAFFVYFDSSSQSAMTMLVIPKKDLMDAFDHYSK